MKKASVFLVAVLMLVLLLATSLAVTAQPAAPGPIVCEIDIEYNIYPDGAYWFGPVSGCILEGTIRFDAVPDEYHEAGKTVHFVEEFTIVPTSGGVIYGKNWGVWNMSTFKFRANGWVRDASPEWAHLVGNKYFEMGTTSNPDDGLPITAHDTLMRVVPANRQNTP